MKIIALFLLPALFLVSCDNDVADEPVLDSTWQAVMSRSGDADVDTDYSISKELLSKYLRLASKGREVSNIIPLPDDKAPVVYHVQYVGGGYEIYAADKRFGLAMIVSDDGSLEDMTTDRYKADIAGLTNYIVTEQSGNSNLSVQRVWAFLDPQPSSNGIRPRGMVAGMWRPVGDTLTEYSDYESPMLTQTAWTPDAPYNGYTPYVAGGTHCKVGCVPMSASQVAYYYRKNNPMGVGVPGTATDNGAYALYDFGDISADNWSKISSEPIECTKMLLAYTGKLMGLNISNNSVLSNYGTEYTVIENYRLASAYIKAFDYYKLAYDYYAGYSYSKIFSSLSKGSPVIFGAIGHDNYGGAMNHASVVDGYRTSKTEWVVNYVWVDGYHPTEEELQRLPQEYFEPPIHDITEGQKRIVIEDDSYFRINWLQNRAQNSKYYKVKNLDPWGDYSYYEPYWNATVDGHNMNFTEVAFIYYNFKNK